MKGKQKSSNIMKGKKKNLTIKESQCEAMQGSKKNSYGCDVVRNNGSINILL